MNILKQARKIWWISKKHHKMRAFYRRYLPTGSLCFDIGAHTGEITSIWLTLTCKVVGFEPLEMCKTPLTKIAQQYPKDFIYHKAALSNRSGWAGFYIGSHPELSTLSTDFIDQYKQQNMFSWTAGASVQTLTLDEAIILYGLPRFIKIDAEGYEHLILEGLHTPVSFVQLEWNELMKKEAIQAIDELQRLSDYRYNWWPGETYGFNEPVFITAEEMIKKLQQMPASILTGEILAAQHLG